MINREKVELELKGDYTLIYPLVAYSEEFEILDKIKTKEDVQKAVAVEEDENQQPTSEYGIAWQKQQLYCNYMEKAKQLWESFTQGKAIDKKKKEQEQKEKEEQLKKEQQKKKAAMAIKLKKQ